MIDLRSLPLALAFVAAARASATFESVRDSDDGETRALIGLVSTFAAICVLFVVLWICQSCHARSAKQRGPFNEKTEWRRQMRAAVKSGALELPVYEAAAVLNASPQSTQLAQQTQPMPPLAL